MTIASDDWVTLVLTRAEVECVKLALSELHGLRRRTSSPDLLTYCEAAKELINVIREQTSQSILATVPALPMPPQGRSAGTCKHDVLLWERCADCELPSGKASGLVNRHRLTAEKDTSNLPTESDS